MVNKFAGTEDSVPANLRESSQFLSSLAEHKLDYVVAIRCNYAVWLPSAKALG